MPDREIVLQSPLPPDQLLFAAMEGLDEIGACFAFDLSMVSPDPELDPKKILGQSVTVSIGAAATARHVNAIVADFGFVGLEEGFARYRATLRPAFWLLSLSTDNRIFQGQSVVEIIEAVLREHPSVKVEKRLVHSYPPRDYCVQYGETDLAFVQRLMEHEGIFYFFEHAEDAHTLILCDDTGKLAAVEGLDSLPWQPDERANFLDGDFIVQWAAVSGLRTSTYTHTDYDFEKPSANLMAQAQDADSFADPGTEAYHYPGNYTAFSRGDPLAGIRVEELQAPRVRATARATAPRLGAGARFDLTGFPRDAENGAYIVLRVRHRLWDGQYQSGMRQAGGMGRPEVGCEVSLELQPAALPYRPERRTPRARMAGPQTAVVVGPPGSEIFTDKYSRVKVQFHWDRLGKKNAESSCFVRVSSVWAGSGWGFIQIPRIGQEVIVDFLEGDPDQPIITGRVYNAEQMPPYALPGKATQSGWKSNSSPGGGGWNELRFEDKKGGEEVWFQAEKDHNELVKNDETRKIGRDWKEEVVRDAKQDVGHDRTETVGHDKRTTVTNDRTVEIGGHDTEHVAKNRKLTVDGDEAIHVVGSSTEDIDRNHFQTVGIAQKILVKAGRMDQVGLAEVRSIGAYLSLTVGLKRDVKVGTNQSHYVIGSDSWTVGRDEAIKIGGNEGSDITGNQSLKLGGNQSWDITGGRLVKVGKGQTHDVTEDVWIKAGKKMKLEAADEITLHCGDATMVMKKDGTITIKGKDLTLEGSGTITGKATGNMILKGSKIQQN